MTKNIVKIIPMSAECEYPTEAVNGLDPKNFYFIVEKMTKEPYEARYIWGMSILKQGGWISIPLLRDGSVGFTFENFNYDRYDLLCIKNNGKDSIRKDISELYNKLINDYEEFIKSGA